MVKLLGYHMIGVVKNSHVSYKRFFKLGRIIGLWQDVTTTHCGLVMNSLSAEVLTLRENGVPEEDGGVLAERERRTARPPASPPVYCLPSLSPRPAAADTGLLPVPAGGRPPRGSEGEGG